MLVHINRMLRQSKKHHLQRVSTLGSKQFWKTIKYLRKSSSQVPTLKRGSTEVTSNAEKASLLNDVFSSNFNDTIHPLSEIDCRNFIADSLSPPPDDILCTEQEVFSLLNALDTSKASGPDGISAKMLKGTAPSIARILQRYLTSPSSVEISLRVGNHRLLSQSQSLQTLTTLQTAGQYPFCQWSAK